MLNKTVSVGGIVLSGQFSSQETHESFATNPSCWKTSRCNTAMASKKKASSNRLRSVRGQQWNSQVWGTAETEFVRWSFAASLFMAPTTERRQGSAARLPFQEGGDLGRFGLHLKAEGFLRLEGLKTKRKSPQS